MVLLEENISILLDTSGFPAASYLAFKINKRLFFQNLCLSVRCMLIVYQRRQTCFDMKLAIKAQFSQNINPHLTQIP